MTAAATSKLIADIEARVRPTICNTYSSTGRCSIEGRISVLDFESLMILAGGQAPAQPTASANDMSSEELRQIARKLASSVEPNSVDSEARRMAQRCCQVATLLDAAADLCARSVPVVRELQPMRD